LRTRVANEIGGLNRGHKKPSHANGQFPDKVIPKFLTMLLCGGQKLTIQGKGTALRNWLHTSDATSALLTVLEKGEAGETYNIGSTNECSVMQVAEQAVKAIVGTSANVSDRIVFVQDRPFNDSRYLILGWIAKRPDGIWITFANIGMYLNHYYLHQGKNNLFCDFIGANLLPQILVVRRWLHS
jgi:nucleoside-diphosphate-sugar epimerase